MKQWTRACKCYHFGIGRIFWIHFHTGKYPFGDEHKGINFRLRRLEIFGKLLPLKYYDA